MIILSLFCGEQNSSAALFEDYALKAALQEERLIRRKGEGGWPMAATAALLETCGVSPADVDLVAVNDEALGSDGLLPSSLPLEPAVRLFRYGRDVRPLPALFYGAWENGVTIGADASEPDGAFCRLEGDKLQFGSMPGVGILAQAYGAATEALGYLAGRHDGKLTGLAAFGAPVLAEAMGRQFAVGPDGAISTVLCGRPAMRQAFAAWAEQVRPADLAASIQAVTEDLAVASFRGLVGAGRDLPLGLTGGLFANVRLNARLAREVPEIFVYPAMGDEGLAVAGGLAFLLRRDGPAVWLGRRRRLSHVSLGPSWDDRIDAELAADPRITACPGEAAPQAAAALAGGRIGAIFQGRVEFGPRALGNRSILASPADASINEQLNARLARSEFMPFAPVVLAQDADRVFDIAPAAAYACRFMTVTVPVREDWKDRIPAVVHVDGTARPQVVDSDRTGLYPDILTAFGAASGLPVLVNTSFNMHEEPIIAAPADCRRALIEGRIDFVVTEAACYRLRS